MISTFVRTTLATAALALAFPLAFAAPLEVAGSTSVQKAILDPVSAKAKDAGIELKIMGVGTGKGMAMLLEGRVAVAAVSDDLNDSIIAAKKAGATTVPGNLKLHTIVNDKMVPIVNPENKVTALTKEQLKDILTGKVTNWKDVGGADQPVLVVTGAPGSGTRGVVERLVMGGAAFSNGAKELRTSAAELSEVARDKGAIGYVGAGTAESAKGKVKEVKAPEVSRPLGLVTVGEPNAEVKKLIDFLQTADAKKSFLD